MSTAASYLQYIPDKLQILTQCPATWGEEPPLPRPRPRPPPPSHPDLKDPPLFLKPPGEQLRRRAVHWTVGVSGTVDGEMSVRWSKFVSEPGGAVQVCSAARECCSEPRTLGGATTLMFPRVHLKSNVLLIQIWLADMTGRTGLSPAALGDNDIACARVTYLCVSAEPSE